MSGQAAQDEWTGSGIGTTHTKHYYITNHTKFWRATADAASTYSHPRTHEPTPTQPPTYTPPPQGEMGMQEQEQKAPFP